MNLDVTDAVEAFRHVLSCSWFSVVPLAERDASGSLLIDWMQANWERLVEAAIPAELGLYLEVYDAGADCNVCSSRVWLPESEANAAVFARHVGNEPLIDALTGTEVTSEFKLGSSAAPLHWKVELAAVPFPDRRTSGNH